MKTTLELQTMQATYQEILEGKRPWTALGNFLNAWYAYHIGDRALLIQHPVQPPAEATPEQQRWAAFCAASVDYLCQIAGLSCPTWVHDPAYCLAEPWYYSLGAQKPDIRKRLEQETPEPFTKRNIFCGNRIFMNKYEEAPQRRSA
ncbi:hypothetical protein KSF_108470 [Reticulibacter mediterranei]|uniref:Uncharacterized protein n=1 Tax=Reticulibacter mediterranei TaxID=2778369 RepID=A0A8J3IRP4_9CHLR|nr:hypothetical protein [Reticulibacter mediterranei]GHP00800.1 hypothetical protein KSF_108470 [Reticulibacter mediterranei]